jgi:hypothetical protein
VPETDIDEDGVPDCQDNCPTIHNPEQIDVCSAGSTIQFILELGGDNHGGNQPFTPGSHADEQSFITGQTITWDVRVAVYGYHSDPGKPSDGLATNGLAGVSFDLELHEGGSDGPLVRLEAGSPTNGWFSSLDATRNAAFARSFNIDGQGGPARDGRHRRPAGWHECGHDRLLQHHHETRRGHQRPHRQQLPGPGHFAAL